jgi:Holliday junction resolvase RusA-like endonuclease
MEAGVLRPKKTPDCDNVLKAIADALNKLAYSDDKNIVDCQIRKYYSHQPRVEITLLPANNERREIC